MTFDRINPSELAAPRGFSHTVSTTRDRTVYLAGQTALDADGKIVGDNVVSQFEQALSNLLVALAAAGGSGSDLATVTIYIVDMDDYIARSRESVPCGDAWSALTTRRWPASGYLACGTSRLSWRSRASPFWSESAMDRGEGVLAGGASQQRIEVSEELRRLAAVPAGRQQLERKPRVEIRKPAPVGEHRDVGLEGRAGGRTG